MKTHLSHILPVHRACEILGYDVVNRMVVSLLSLRGHQQSNSNNSSNSNNGHQQRQVMLLVSNNNNNNECQTLEEEIEKLIEALHFRLPPENDDANEQNENDDEQEEKIFAAAKRMIPSPSRTLSGGSSHHLTTISEDESTTNTSNMMMTKRRQQQQVQQQEQQTVEMMMTWQKRWISLRPLALDKATLLHFVVPQTVQPHAGPSGHQGLFDCWVYALQGHNASPSPAQASYYTNSANSGGGGALAASNMVWLPDVIILLAVVQQYRDFRLNKDKKRQQEQQYLDNDTDAHNEALMDDHDHDHNNDHQHNDHQQPKENGRGNINNEQQDHEEESEESLHDKAIVWTMAQLAFIIYDSYQKKGTVTRDTIHRFLTDVYGEDSYKEPPARLLLDEMFRVKKQHNHNNQHPADVQAAAAANGTGAASSPSSQQQQQGGGGSGSSGSWLHASLNQEEFCNEVLHTIQWSRRSHLLLDWMSVWMCAMIPTPEIPPSVAAYLDTMEMKPRPICSSYLITEGRLFEVKRRFHSMVRVSPTVAAAAAQQQQQQAAAALASVIQRDNNGGAADESSSTVDGGGGGGVGALASTTCSSQHGSLSGSDAAGGGGGGGTAFHPKHAVGKSAFIEAVSQVNEEMGSGGYLPPSLAGLVFQAACRGGENNGPAITTLSSSSLDNNDISNIDAASAAMSSQLYWGLHHVLQFGCMAVRRNTAQPEMPDIPLLRFLFAMFQLAAPPTTTEDFGSITGGGSSRFVEEYEDRRILTRNQVQAMLLLLIEHAEFRLKSDGAHRYDQHFNLDDDNNKVNKKDEVSAAEPTRGVTRATSTSSTSSFASSNDPGVSVDREICHLLGIMPPKMSKSSSSSPSSHHKISLKKLVDATLADTAEKDSLTFEEFCEWSTSAPEDGPSSRLGYLMLDLRLIAAVLFGIPPTMASMEVSLIAEIERRHRSRYPQTTVSRRGPRGTVWYIIDAHWFKEWSSCVKAASGTEQDGQDGRNDVKGGVRGLERIDNAGLLADNGSLALRADIRWKHDYEILPPLAWYALQAWYDGGPPIHRTVVRYVGGSSKPSSPHSAKARIPTENEIELYPYFVTVYLCDAASRGEARPFQQNYQLSRVTPVGVMLVQLCKELDVDADLARLWVMTGGPPNHSITGSSNTPEGADDWILNLESNIVEQRKMRSQANSTDHSRGITLLLELKDPETKLWPRGVDGKEWAFRDKNENEQIKDLGDGVVGLYNMGNTCYLNSSIQCISHTPIFREYFTSKAYLNDINTTNPLGYQGHLAQVSAVLINSLWKPFNQNNPVQPKRVTAPGSYVMVNAQSLTPKTFKESLGKFNELFSGNEQHDAQELLTFLLAGLSEDLNRIMEKPYIEAPDSDGRPDRELADIWWANHLRREMSIVVALFTGQYKNLLTCRTCKYESARFEPFATLTVPLPEDDHLTAYCILYPLADGADTLKYCLRVRSDGNLHDVLLELAKVLIADEEGSDGSTAPKTIAETNGKEKENGDEKGTERETDPAVIGRAQNLAVVDMRDGYIFKIAPNSWSLQDLQNKDTGDLPQLHVYELDTVPDDPEDAKTEKTATEGHEDDSTNYDDEDSENDQDSKFGFLAIVQRRSEVVSRDYLHPLAHRVFGTPLLVRMVDMEAWTGRQLYDMVARRLRNIVPKTALRFLAATTSSSKSKPSSSSAIDDKEESSGALTLPADQLDKDSRGSNMSTTTTDMEEVSAGSVPRYGFRLRVTTRDGRRCLICPWYKCCIGCLVPDDYAPAAVMNGDSVVVDWHFAVDVATSGFGLRAVVMDPISAQPSPIRQPQRSSTVTVKNHSSCGAGAKRGGQAGVITLEECLDAFAKEERIPEAYCSKCKDFRVQTTRMTLWRLPPVLIIHLKRFQFTQTMRRKLRDLVLFPLEGLDLSRIMALDGGDVCRVVPDANTKQTSPLKKPQQENGDADDSTQATTESAAAAAEADGIKDDKGRSEMLYDLYGVVHHQGALSGGHYVASLKSELDGQWRLFNDAQIYEIHARDVVDSSAYILFYIRRDMIGKKLSDVWNVRKEGNLSAEDMDQLLKGKSDRCVIS